MSSDKKWGGNTQKILEVLMLFGVVAGFLSALSFSLSGIVVGFVIVGISFLLMVMSGRAAQRQFPGTWEATAAEMGLKETANHLWAEGDYRNHHVSVWEAETTGGGGETSRYTLCEVRFENPQKILLSIGGILGRGGDPYIGDKRTHLFKVGDADFDRGFYVTGNNEAAIKNALTQPLRNKITTLGYLPGRISIGYSEEPFPSKESNTASYPFHGRFKETKQHAGRLRLIVDIVIDILEEIEPPTA